MVIVYADLRHADPALYHPAVIKHRTYDLTLVTDLDFPSSVMDKTSERSGPEKR
jgi:hypothetical protein